MADSYLNKSGLSYFWTKIKNALSLKTDKTDFDLVDRYYRALVPVGTEITSNKNLNTVEFLSVGKYYCRNNATTATLTNCPTGGKAFMMEVFSPLSTTIDNETTGTWVYRTRVITSYEGKTWYQSCYSNATVGNWIYGGWQYVTNSGDVNNQIYANINSKYGKVQCITRTTTSGQWVKIASMSHHARTYDNVNYTFRLDFTGSTQYRQSYTFGVGARMTNTTLQSVRFDYLDSEEFNYSSAPELEDLVKVTRKFVAGSSSADHYIYFEIWVHLVNSYKTYWLHPTNMNYKGDYSINQAFFRDSDEWTYSSISGTSAAIGQETYLTEGYEEVSMVDARKGVSYLDPIYTTRQTTADAPEINGRGGIRTFVATGTMTDKPEGQYGNIIHLDWDNTGGWDSQLLVSHVDSMNAPRIYARSMNSGTWSNWVKFIREQDLEAAIDELAGEKVSYKRSYTTATTVSYKKITVQGGTYATDGAGALIFTREERFMVDGMCASGYGGRLLELGTSHNLSEPTTSNRWVKLKVYGVPDSRTTEIYCKMSPYTYVDVHSSGTITIEDSTEEEYTNAHNNATYIPLDPNNTYWANVKISNTSATNTTPTFGNIALTSSYPQIKGNGTLYLSSDTSWGEGNRGTLILQNGACRPSSSQNGTMDLGASNAYWRNLYLDGVINHNSKQIQLQDKAGTIALISDIEDNIHAEDPIGAVSITSPLSGSNITDNSVSFEKVIQSEFLKLESTTVDPGEGVPLAPNTLLAVYDVVDDYKNGETLVVAQNTDMLYTSAEVATPWESGTWSQYGRMAHTSNPYRLTISNNTDNDWVVELSVDCPNVIPGMITSAAQGRPSTGICELDSTYAISKVISWTSIRSVGPIYNRKYVTIPANTTKNYCACYCTYVNDSGVTGTWYAGDESTTTAVDYFGGASCTLKAVLIDNGE